MGLLQKAVETYDAHEALAGKERAGHQTLAPIGHKIANAGFEITIDAEGKLVDITKVEKDDAKTVIPVTEESAGRTSAPRAHPLCEQVGYLSGDNKEKYTLYIEQLEKWSNSDYSHPMLKPILQYVKGKTLLSDLKNHEINPEGGGLIRFRVIGIGEESGACWKNQNLFKSFLKWYSSLRINSENEVLCMISGEKDMFVENHPNVSVFGKAKLISYNSYNNNDYTAMGQFTDKRQALTVGYMSSQKVFNVLDWLVSEQGKQSFGGRVFLCWNPKGKKVPQVGIPLIQSSSSSVSPTDYKRELTRTINGFRNELPETEGVVIAAFDAATTGRGRLALTYYNELQASDFIDRLKVWDENCCWWGWNPEHQRYDVIQSMPLYQIVNCAFGAQREEKGSYKFVTDDRIMRQQMQNLIACRIDKGKFPKDIAHQLVIRASNPQAYDKRLYGSLLITTCAVIKKYHFDHQKEEIDMQLEENRADRSYLFGRLLAVMEKAEKDTYTDFDNGNGRETNAIKLQSAFCQHPLHTAKNIEAQLERAYFPKLSTPRRMYYKKLIGEIIAQLSDICKDTPNEWNRALDDTYLIGYYLQRNALYKSKKENEEDE